MTVLITLHWITEMFLIAHLSTEMFEICYRSSYFGGRSFSETMRKNPSCRIYIKK